jgi:hypothetical protein
VSAEYLLHVVLEGFLGQIEVAEEEAFRGDLMDVGEETLQAIVAILSFEGEERRRSPTACQRSVVRTLFPSDSVALTPLLRREVRSIPRRGESSWAWDESQ